MSTVRTDHDGRVTVVTIDRPEVRNAVDRATADALAGSTYSRCAACLIPVSGDLRFRSMSTARAFSGETYSTRVRRLRSAGTGAAFAHLVSDTGPNNALYRQTVEKAYLILLDTMLLVYFILPH